MANRHTGPVRKVSRRGEDRWVIDFLWMDKSGQKHRYRKDASLQTRSGAMLEAQSLHERAMRTGTLHERAAKPTFSAFVEGSFKALRMPHFRPATRVRYEALLRQGLLDHFRPLRLDEITQDSVHSYAAKLNARGVSTKAGIMFLRTILKSACELGVVDEVPKLPRLWKESRKLPDAPPMEDIESLISGTSSWLALAVALAAFAGLRSGEVRALECRDVDLAAGRITLRHAFSENELSTPKSGHERLIPIAPILRPFLETAVRSKLPKARLVVTSTGATPTRQAILTRLKTLEAKLEIRPWSFHQIRHFFYTELIQRGADVETVRVLAGHASISVTQRYLHATGNTLAHAVGRLTAT